MHLAVVPHTRWDREWYQPFQELRAGLVEMVDGLVETLEEDPGFAHFHLDGQTAVLEGCLEIRPSRRRLLRRLVREGRIAVGPWYVLPDELLPSGEALIRSLWEAPDGRSVFTVYLPHGYMNGFGLVDEVGAMRRGTERVVAALRPFQRAGVDLVTNGLGHRARARPGRAARAVLQRLAVSGAGPARLPGCEADPGGGPPRPATWQGRRVPG